MKKKYRKLVRKIKLWLIGKLIKNEGSHKCIYCGLSYVDVEAKEVYCYAHNERLADVITRRGQLLCTEHVKTDNSLRSRTREKVEEYVNMRCC